MYRGPSIGFGVFLAVVGAILAFAVADRVQGVDLQMIGYICLAAGIILVLIGIAMGARSNRSATERHVTRDAAGGTHESIEHRDV
ncbi:hypothetical protein SAMN02910418_02409 [Bowdeniella nasicola]|uniref:DUF6458 domain-containing protein n=1 Tax=Bowdeniella nasicola TaxID=208480 RepID=A0A1H4E1I7_9ACTO|nr:MULTISPECIES: DUF6458 family protein [Bowdeniella]SEA78687.1 hypothetical protein SAMN02910418_02409 [Bowdeniella nasicola]